MKRLTAGPWSDRRYRRSWRPWWTPGCCCERSFRGNWGAGESVEPECPNALHPKCGAVDIFFYERKRAKKAGARGIRTTAVYVAVGAAYAPVPKPVAPAFRASLDSGLSRPFGDTQRMGFVNMATQTSPPSHPQYRARAIHSLRQSVQRTTPDIENGPPPPPPQAATVSPYPPYSAAHGESSSERCSSGGDPRSTPGAALEAAAAEY